MRFGCGRSAGGALCSLLLASAIICGSARYPPAALTPLPFIVEYALWRGWHQVLIFTNQVETGCQWATIRLMKCLSVNGVASATDSLVTPRIHARLGIIILGSRFTKNTTEELTNLIKKLHELQMGTASYDWLITTRSEIDIKYINTILNRTSIRFDQNIVVAYPDKYTPEKSALGLCDSNFDYKINSKSGDTRRMTHCHDKYKYKNDLFNTTYDHKNLNKSYYERNYFRTSERFKKLSRSHTFKKNGKSLPLPQSGIVHYNYSRSFNMINISKFSLKQKFREWIRDNNGDLNVRRIHVVQYFKVRLNSTLYAYYLGCWDREESMSGIEIPYPVEARNFMGERLVVGRCNSTGEGTPFMDDEGPSAPDSLDDVLYFWTVRLNTSSVTRYYNKLGFRTYEGTWTGLLGALMDNSVDIALETVTAHATRHQDMDFIFPIAKTMCNIYIRQQETSTVRDIFLAPFSPSLVGCVVAVAVMAAMAAVLISNLTVSDQERRMGCIEALIWSTGILCQQGGSWTPPNSSASVLLIVCLLFAVVTYNAYAAFITSVLSVRVASVDDVAAVLQSPNLKLGYIRNGADQMYLMSTKDIQLNAFYIRGYSYAENLVTSAEEGLTRVANQDYAFFAGQRAARSTLRSMSQARGRCGIRELPVHSTRAQLAFPLPRHSPYARPILVSLLQLRSGGTLARLEAALVPEMPQCAPPPGFASARAADVRSALILLVTGYIVAVLIGLGEYCWKNRKELRVYLVGCYRRFLILVK